MTHTRILASNAADPVRIFGGAITAATTSRMLGGELVRYGVVGQTSAGPLKVREGGLRFPDDLTRVKLTEEHDRSKSRGYLASLEYSDEAIRAYTKVADGPTGDAALREAADKTRDSFSYDVINAHVVGDEIVSADVVAIGQVGIPAHFGLSRIDMIAASTPNPTTGGTMNAEQIARLAALRAKTDRTAEEEAELTQLAALESTTAAAAQQQPQNPPTPAVAAPSPSPASAAPGQVAASLPAVPGGIPAPGASTTRVTNEPNLLDQFVASVTAAFQTGNLSTITAALADVTHAQHSSIIEAPGWSGELWSGLQYEPMWVPLFATGDLTNFEGAGWRFTQKPEMKDYAGNKAEIPTGPVTTEPAGYTAARMAVGHDLDRKFFDFPNEAFLRGLLEAVRESWAMKLDDKVRAYAIANAVAVPGGSGGTQPTLLKAAAKAARYVKRRTRARATFVAVNSDDFDTLLDYTEKDVPAFLELFNIKPENFVDDPSIPSGTVLSGVKQAATVRTLPGSPIRVDAQNIARGGVDEGFFGYWAVEEHHVSGIASVQFVAPVEGA